MTRLLYIKASPRGERSHSVAVADAFVEAWKQANPDGVVEERELFAMDLPSFDGSTIQGKYNIMHGQEYTEAEREAWSAVEAIIEDFKNADGYVFAVPMWNFSLPYRLKHYLDIIIQPTYTVGFEDGGYVGLVTGKKAFAAYARGGGPYGEGNPVENMDFQSTYLRAALGFMGITDLVSVAAEGMLGPDREKNKGYAVDRARELGAMF